MVVMKKMGGVSSHGTSDALEYSKMMRVERTLVPAQRQSRLAALVAVFLVCALGIGMIAQDIYRSGIVFW